jgi:hypothetical protein
MLRDGGHGGGSGGVPSDTYYAGYAALTAGAACVGSHLVEATPDRVGTDQRGRGQLEAVEHNPPRALGAQRPASITLA